METVEMSASERREYEAFKAAKAKREAAEKAKEDREAYKTLVDDSVAQAADELMKVSTLLAEKKAAVMELFRGALVMKEQLFGVKSGQRSHTFTNSDGTARIILGYNVTDDYRDTVDEGIALVSEYIESLARDDNSKMLVRAVMRLMSRDNQGNLKASRVLQLRKMADESGDEKFIKGVQVIEESYQPAISKQYVRMDLKEPESSWKSVALGMTEA